MDCRELVERVTEYLDDALAPDDRARLERHLADCPACTRYLEQIRVTIAAAGALRDTDLDERMRTDLGAVFERWRRTR
ncbi:anti-sigma factor [Paraconexibacter algicola]|uniref:Anti-sigma factor n=2 Tax=Paraconexibacter algicola TaxID=2133960 RepID=A0A2T4UH76_9ACTN|nr:anti-sigma factor [Paraconexibacter algicola]